MRRLAALLAVLAFTAATATAEAKQLVRYNIGGGLAGISGAAHGRPRRNRPPDAATATATTAASP